MKEFGLPKSCLLKTTWEFNRVYRLGKRRKGEGYAVIFRENGRAESRLGISVHRKAGNAVRRNRIKRIVREVFRLHREQFPAASDIVFTVRPEFSINNAKDLQASIAGSVGRHES